MEIIRTACKILKLYVERCIAPKITDETIIASVVLKSLFSLFTLFITNKKGIIKIISSAINWISVDTKKLLKLSGVNTSKIEDIGARRLHTIIEKVLEDISFESDSYAGKSVEVGAELVKDKLGEISQSEDLARYIL